MAYLLNQAPAKQGNPFTPDFGKRPRRLVGHGDLLSTLQDGLTIGPADPRFTSLLLGPRGYGKTVMLEQVEDLAESSGWIVLSLDASSGGIEDSIDKLIAWAHDRHEDMPDVQTDQTVRQSTGVRLWGLEWQREVATKIQPRWDIRRRLLTLAEHASKNDRAVLITLDEMHNSDPVEIRKLAAELQYITKRKELPLAFIGAGLAEMHHTLLEDKKMTFFQRCSRFDIPPLTLDEVEFCLSRTVQDAKGSFAEEALATLTQISGGSPYKTQLSGFHAWESADAPLSPIDDRAAEQAIEATEREYYHKVAISTWHSLGQTEQTMLRVIASLGGVASRTKIGTLTRLRPRSLSQAEQHLVNMGCATVDSDDLVRITGLLSVQNVIQTTATETAYTVSPEN